ncbi:trehalose-phosphatase [Candidatus Daviesbacteria bacterium]|nr:trehalose-phosphatase [Candidatus Daviesbacteria bacterium]
MKYLWNDLNKITALLKSNSPKLILLDFDGTLAPIVKRPDQAKLPPETKQILLNLSKNQNFYLGIISGRELSDIKAKIGIPNIIYAGNHGLQGNFFGKKFLHPAAEKAVPVIKKIRLKTKQIAEKYGGVLIEDKKIALGFHYRMAEQSKAKEIKSALDEVIKPFLDNKLISQVSGKKEVDILPKAEWNKGDFAKLIMGEIYSKTKSHPVVVVIGDDTTDENAFGDFKNDITVVVGKNSKSQAKYYLKNINDVSIFLKKINGLL